MPAAYCRQENSIFSPNIPQTWPKPFSGALSVNNQEELNTAEFTEENLFPNSLINVDPLINHCPFQIPNVYPPLPLQSPFSRQTEHTFPNWPQEVQTYKVLLKWLKSRYMNVQWKNAWKNGKIVVHRLRDIVTMSRI